MSTFECLQLLRSYTQNLLYGNHQIMEHPNAPIINVGDVYQPNSIEKQFVWLTRMNYLYIIPFTAVGGFGMVTIFRRFLPPVPSQHIYFLIGIMGGFTGTQMGIEVSYLKSSYDLMYLRNSPYGSEARYKIWRKYPQSRVLKEFKSDTNKWHKYWNIEKLYYQKMYKEQYLNIDHDCMERDNVKHNEKTDTSVNVIENEEFVEFNEMFPSTTSVRQHF
eukprot:71905_1